MPRGKSAGLNNPQLLEAALEGLELQRQRLDEQISQVRGMLGGRGRGGQKRGGATAPAEPPDTVEKGTRKRRKLSAAARKRIAAAQKKRWAEYRKSETGTGAASSAGRGGAKRGGRRGGRRGRPAKKTEEGQS